MLIGEIRDKETATIAIEAALTGHLVLSSLHTNDAPSAISRLVEMDVETFLVASSIDAVVAQRLARILCDKCKQPYRPDEMELQAAGFPEDRGRHRRGLPGPRQPVEKNDCKACSGTGYRGRVGLYEVMLRSEEIERLTVERASADAIRAVAIEQGMKTLRDDGLDKVRAGITSIEEVARVVKEMSSVVQQDEDVQIPVPELLGSLLEKGDRTCTSRRPPPMVRVHGELEPAGTTRRSRRGRCRAWSTRSSRRSCGERFEQELELDMSYSLPGRSRFRVNVFQQRDAWVPCSGRPPSRSRTWTTSASRRSCRTSRGSSVGSSS